MRSTLPFILTSVLGFSVQFHFESAVIYHQLAIHEQGVHPAADQAKILERVAVKLAE
ncbi:MAG: hypothetical protein P8074_27710 [Anaerolineales bacterium]